MKRTEGPDRRRLLAAMLLTVIVAAGQFWFSFIESPGRFALAVAVSLAAECLLSLILAGSPRASLLSAYMTGVSIGILVRSPFYWPYAAGSALAILQKRFLRYRGKGLFNPSNFGLCLLLVAFPESVTALGKQWSNHPEVTAIIFLFGAYVIARIGRLPMVAAYVLAFVLFGAGRAVLAGAPVSSELAPALGPAFQLFIFFMITDPRTTPSERRPQIVYALAVAAIECLFRLGHVIQAPFYALFLVAPLAMLREARRTPT